MSILTFMRQSGRREANKTATRERIRVAAAASFDALGYEATTTSEVASAAGIGAGTLFNYASTKGELLFLVLTHRLRAQLDEVVESRERPVRLEEALVAAIEPLDQLSRAQPELTALFLRELLFGADGPNRREAQQIVAELQHRLSRLLIEFTDQLRRPELVDEATSLLFAIAVQELMARVRHRDRFEQPSQWPTLIGLALNGLTQPD